MCAVLGQLIVSHQNPTILDFHSQQLLSCFTWSDALYLELIEWTAPAAYYKTSLLLMKKTNVGEKQSYCSLSRAQSGLVQGGPARPCARMGMLLRCREREVHTVFCYRLPTAQPWKAEMQRHENVICENQHVITASLFSAGSFGWQVLSEDNLHVSYLCYLSTHAKITQTLVSFGKNTSQHNACQCVLNCMLHN